VFNTCTNVRLQEKPFQLTTFDRTKLGFGLDSRNSNLKSPQTRSFNEIQLEILQEKRTKKTKSFYKQLKKPSHLRGKLFPMATRAKRNVATR